MVLTTGTLVIKIYTKSDKPITEKSIWTTNLAKTLGNRKQMIMI